MSDPPVLLSGFADEAAPDKTLDQQLTAMAALGLSWVTLRFVDCGNGVRNVVELESTELQQVRKRLDEFGLAVSSIGSPIGKVKIADVEDGTANRYVPFRQYLQREVPRAIDAAVQLDSRLIRGFSFYFPQNQPPRQSLSKAIDQLGQIADQCARHGLTFGLEVEANLTGHTGQLLAEIHAAVSSPSLVLVFDGGNLVTQGFSSREIFEQFLAMLPGLGWMHVKDYTANEKTPRPGEFVDEAQLSGFVPADRGDTDHVRIFSELRSRLPQVLSRLQQQNIDGFFVDLEPHLKSGGQYGGYSGPDGMGIALRALCNTLQLAGVGYQLREWNGMPRPDQADR